jgi:hypothetical protein
MMTTSESTIQILVEERRGEERRGEETGGDKRTPGYR